MLSCRALELGRPGPSFYPEPRTEGNYISFPRLGTLPTSNMGCPFPHPPLPARSLVSTCTCGSIPEVEPAPRGLLADELRRQPEWDPYLQGLPQPTRGARAGRTPQRPGRLPLDGGGGLDLGVGQAFLCHCWLSSFADLPGV